MTWYRATIQGVPGEPLRDLTIEADARPIVGDSVFIEDGVFVVVSVAHSLALCTNGTYVSTLSCSLEPAPSRRGISAKAFY